MVETAQAIAAPDHDAIRTVFNDLFRARELTILCAGAAEPLYEPWGTPATRPDRRFARIHYRADYAASALHEVAHWCIAGVARRRQVDYGYWYAPDGRDGARQREFMRVEARPQALEWVFSQGCGLAFGISFDNLDAPPTQREREAFGHAVVDAARQLAASGLPPRAERFLTALCGRFRPGLGRAQLTFDLHQLL